MQEVTLKVMEALQEEAYKGIVRIDTETMREIGVRVGDVVEIEGGRETVGIVDRAYPTDIGQTVIRMDGILRRNAKTGIGEAVKVRKADVHEAKSVTIAPAQKGVTIKVDPNLFKRGLLGRAVIKGDILALGGTRRRRTAMSDSPFFEDVFPIFGEDFMGGFGISGLRFIVADGHPKGALIITENTELRFSPKAVDILEEKVPYVTYEDVGGLSDEIKKVREMVELPLKHPELFERLGIDPPKGILLHGPPGCGKTLLAKAVANESDASFLVINGPEVVSKFVGEAEKKIREKFEEAEKKAPSILFIDEIDAIATKREESYGEVEKRMVAQLLATMDGLNERGKVIVIAATNRPNALDPALRRPGRFDREIVIGVPSKEGRLSVLKIHTRNMPLKDVDLKYWAEKTHGFVGADLAALCKEAAITVIRRILPDINWKESQPIPKEILDKLVITQSDFEEAMRLVSPSGMREVLVEVPNVKWDDIGGLEEMKQELKEAVEWPLKYPHKFKEIGIRAPRGILVYGPPGCGKTMLAKAVAHESEANFILVKGPELLNMWVGESLPYNEEVLVKKNGTIKRMKIGDIVERKEDVEVLTFDRDKRMGFAKITDYLKHPLTSQLVEVTTKTGRKIRVTTDHSLFSFVNGRLTSVPTSHLIPGESYVAIPKHLNLPKERIKELDLYDFFKNDKTIFVSNVGDSLQRARKVLGTKRVAELLEVTTKSLRDTLSKNLPVAIHRFDAIMREAKLVVDVKEIGIKAKGSIHTYPALFPIDSDFWELVGLWVAEGDLNGYTVRIHNCNPEIRTKIREICTKYHLSMSMGETATTINSLFLQKIFKNMLGLETGAERKRVPEMVFILDRESKACFLRGYFSGNGSNYPAERGKFKIEAGTVSRELANDLLYLLLDFGIVATLYKRKERTVSTMHRISILGVEKFQRFRQIGFIDKKRNLRITRYIISRRWARSDTIPLKGELYQFAVEQNNCRTNSAIGKERFRQLLLNAGATRESHKEYWDLIDGDLYFDLVKEIKVIDNEEFVYDISVPEGQNFVAGFGGVCAHNSEKGIRQIFKKARQVAPTVIFFDEIDSIASRRGMNGGNNVTERMVNTLLTEIDGLEELHNVVVIAATNRPDILDPALLRPGRFDRLLLTPLPDEKERTEIFKIHTKNMPLAKDVNLKKLVEKTPGFVGSDVEGTCREAGMLALREDIKATQVCMRHFEKALEKTRPSIREEDMKKYKEIEESYIRTARGAAIQMQPANYFG